MISEKEVDLIGHSIGICIRTAESSQYKKNKKLPDEYYRNYFCAGSEDHADYKYFSDMEKRGLVKRGSKFGDIVFFITPEGISEFEKVFQERVVDTFIPPSKSKEEYQNYVLSEASYENGFADHLGIQLPEYEYQKGSSWYSCNQTGLVRMVSTKYHGVRGEYCKNRKLAKASYKEHLNKFLSYKKQNKLDEFNFRRMF